MAGGRFHELLNKYGKVALGVHCSVSAASIAGLYLAINININTNVDVQSLIHYLPNLNPLKSQDPPPPPSPSEEDTKRNRTAEMVAGGGGALALAFLCNKALLPIRVPITLAVTPPLAKFLARRRLVKTGL